MLQMHWCQENRYNELYLELEGRLFCASPMTCRVLRSPIDVVASTLAEPSRWHS